jgi:uncharacterized membrane protein/predicted flap endonuclease-1-like 5' DNA nuclease
MAENKNNVMVVAYYVNEDAAAGAAEDLKKWDDANDDIKLGAIAVLTLDPKSGEIKANDVGQRNTKKGALWGTAIGAVAGILTAGIGLIPGLLVGAGGGGALGALSHKDVGMTDEDREKMAGKLRNGGAALAVMCDDFEVEATKAEMARVGGETESYGLSDVTAAAISTAAVAQSAAAKAADEGASADADAADEAARAIGIDVSDVQEKLTAIASGILATTGLDADAVTKVREAGIDRPSRLLEMGSTPEGRKELAEETGISEEQILAAVKLVDLMRVKGIGIKSARLLEAAGVTTVLDLAQRNPENLHAAVEEANQGKKYVEMTPYQGTVTDWVNEAKALPRVVTY